VDQPPKTPKVLFCDTNMRLSEQGKTFVLEYLAGGQIEFSEQYDCKLCALRALLLATIQLTGPCTCAPAVLRIEDQDIVAQFAGGRN
jgi:hypothetical protein